MGAAALGPPPPLGDPPFAAATWATPPPPPRPPRAGVELRVRAVSGLPPASRAAVVVTVRTPAGDAHATADFPVVAGRARLEAWTRLALPREAGGQRALSFEVGDAGWRV